MNKAVQWLATLWDTFYCPICNAQYQTYSEALACLAACGQKRYE